MKASRTRFPAARDASGFTILEVVVAMIIISILTLVMMPTITNRANQARTASAEADMRVLADAQSRASIDMNYYIVPWRLNNVIGSSDVRRNASNPATDDNQPPYSNWNDMFIDTITLEIPGNVDQIYDDFIDNETDFGWRGPYVNFKRFDNAVNWPQDPWGNEYVLVTKAGILFAPDPDEAPTTVEFTITDGPDFIENDGTANTGISVPQGIFDRPTWISFGPNGVPGDGSGDEGSPVGSGPGFYGNGDDLIFAFEGFDGSDGT